MTLSAALYAACTLLYRLSSAQLDKTLTWQAIQESYPASYKLSQYHVKRHSFGSHYWNDWHNQQPLVTDTECKRTPSRLFARSSPALYAA